MMLTGAQIVIECLKEQGVDTVFGFPGGTILNIYDELYKHSSEIKHYLTSHEQGAAHAADGYARSTGKVGVCLATSGPGATNLVTGIATAYMDSTPMVAITANVPTNLIGKDSFQEIDICGVTLPITKHNFLVKDIKDLARILREAFHIAKSGRPGPVLVDIPKDITAQKTEYTFEEPKKSYKSMQTLNQFDLDNAADLLMNAKKPFIMVGGGAVMSQAEKELFEFAKKLDAPVTCSLMGTGAFPGEDPLYTGMIGMHGSKASNIGITRCDLLVVIGARFSDRVIGRADTFAKKADILHIDLDPAEINKNIASDHFVIGDIKEVLGALNAKIEQMDHKEWIEEVECLKEKFPLKVGEGLTGQYVIEKLYELTNGDALVCTEVGQHQMWAAQYYKFKKPRQLITSGGLGTMGFGMGAAIGTKLGNPDKTVLNIAGDGCFRMNLNELITAVKYDIPIVVVVINNQVLGMVRQWQTLFYDERYSYTDLGPGIDYVKLCEAFGAVGFNLERKEDADEVLKKALATGRPTVVNCVIDKDFKVFPMVPPGKSIDELILD
jgi:acetolactate synthase-1/2/3 large subunit